MLSSWICNLCISQLESYVICKKIDESFVLKCVRSDIFFNDALTSDMKVDDNVNNDADRQEISNSYISDTIGSLDEDRETFNARTEEKEETVKIKEEVSEMQLEDDIKQEDQNDIDIEEGVMNNEEISSNPVADKSMTSCASAVTKQVGINQASERTTQRIRRRYSRITVEQRQVMLKFMQDHPALPRGQLTGSDGVKIKKELMQKLANKLNAIQRGPTKSPYKWIKSWQDWRSDVKCKAARLNKEAAKSGGSAPIQLTPLENRLLGIIGKEITEGIGIPDPLNMALNGNDSSVNIDADNIAPTSANNSTHSSNLVPISAPSSVTTPSIPVASPSPPPVPSATPIVSAPPPVAQPKNLKRRRTNEDNEDNRFLKAMELQASSLEKLANAVERIANIGSAFLERLGDQCGTSESGSK